MNFPAPRDLYSFQLKNNTGKEVSAKVTYTKNKTENEVVEKKVSADTTVAFEQKTFKQGSAEFTYVISQVEFGVGDLSLIKNAPFDGINSPTKGLEYCLCIKEGKVCWNAKVKTCCCSCSCKK